MMINKLLTIFSGVGMHLVLPALVLAGGGLIMTDVSPTGGALQSGEQYIIRPTVYTDNSYTTKCNKCPIKIKLEYPESSDYIAQSDNETDENGSIYAKVISNIPGDRLVYSEVVMPDGTTYQSSRNVLNYVPGNPPSEPYPTVYPPTGAPYPKPTTIVLTPGPGPFQTTTYPKPKTTIYPNPRITVTGPQSIIDPNLKDDPKVKELEFQVQNLRDRLDESQKRQSELEIRLSSIIAWIKSIFPFFK